MAKNKKLFIGLGTAVALVAIGLGLYFFVFANKDFVTVNGKKVSTSELKVRTAKILDKNPTLFTKEFGGLDKTKLNANMKDSLINEALLVQEAKKRNLKVSNKTINASFDAFTNKYGTKQDLEVYLTQNKLSEKDIKDALINNLYIAELAKDLVSEKDITTAEAKAYYQAHIETYTVTPSKKVSQILFAANDMQTAQSVEAKLAAGENFSDLAKKYSKDTVSAKQGGDLGWSTSPYPATFQSTVDSLKKGEVSQPFATDYGIHIIKLTDVRNGSSSFEDAKVQVIADLLGEKRAAAIGDLLKALQAEAKIN